MKWTAEQIKIIESRGQNLLVSASAGSGKTTVMIERIVALMEDGYRLEDFLVSTFTKASAADMKQKLTKRLRDSGNPALITQIKNLPDADITNLDSWCKKLVAKYFYAVGVDPDFEILGEGEARAELDSAINEVFGEYVASGDEHFARLRDFMTTARRDDDFRGCIKSLYYHISLYAEPDEALDACSRCDMDEYLQQKDAAKRHELVSDFLLYSDECKKAGFERNIEPAKAYAEWLKGNGAAPATVKGNVGDFTELNEKFKALTAKAKTLMENTSGDKKLPPYAPNIDNTRKIVEITRKVKRAFDSRKKKKGVLDFADLEHLAYKILCINEINREISSRYKFVFVDEYQDVNPLQERIISLVSAQKFMVGDLKQSIYAFRGCRPDIFENRADAYDKKQGGELILLNVNYRCGKQIVDFVNEIFCKAMTKKTCGVDYARDAFLVAGAKKEGFRPGIVRYLAQKEEAEGLYEVADTDTFSPEAEGVASRIAELVAGIEENGQKRAFGYGEIAVLVRSTGKDVTALTQNLRKMGIPYQTSKKLAFSAIKEVRMLISCLRLIDNNTDEIALVGAMLSHVGGFTPDELAQIRGESRSFCDAVYAHGKFFDRAPQNSFKNSETAQNEDIANKAYSAQSNQNGAISAETTQKLRIFLEKLRRYNDLSIRVSADELAGIIVEENDFFLHTFATDGDAEGLDEFLSYVCEHPQKNSLHAFLTALECEPEYSSTSGGNAVKIMTIHGSKGLEFPAVILMSAGKKFNFSNAKLKLAVSGDRIALKGFDEIGGKEHETDLYRAILGDKIESERAEELRLLYVALTRAQEFLEIYGTGNGGYMGIIEHALDSYGIDAPDAMQKGDSTAVANFQKDEKLTAKIKQRIDFALELSDAPEKTYVTRLVTQEKAEESQKTDTVSRNLRQNGEELRQKKDAVSVLREENRGYEEAILTVSANDEEGAMLRGTAYHEALENVDFENFEATFEALSEDVKRAVDKRKVETAAKKVGELVKGKKVYREQPFILPVDASEYGYSGGTTLVQGVIDLMAIGDGAVVVDYKTGSASYAFCESNVRQIKLYARAVKDILGVDAKTYIMSIDTGILKEV